MKLSIDVSSPEVGLELVLNKKTVGHKFMSERNLSEQLMLEIEKFLKKQKASMSELKKIEVIQSPNFFSRTRTAVATANALSFALNLKQKLIQPVYSKAPNITKPK